MNVIRAFAKDAGDAVAMVDDPEALRGFLKPESAAAVWRRETERSFQSWIDGVEPTQLPQARIVLRPTAVRAALAELCDDAGMPQGPERTHLIDDVTDLAQMFANLMETEYLRLRLQAVTSNACRRFHVDAITARLICTYRGAGTQYGVSADGGDPAQIFTVPTGAPILLRGSLWPETPSSGLLHRSPPIEGTGETRLVLVLDPISDPGQEM